MSGKLHWNGQYYAGARYNFPTLNCCACGQQDRVFFESPSFVPNSCTHKDEENSKSEHIVNFCKGAKDATQCTLGGNGSSWRSLHCMWNVDAFEMVFDE